MDLNKFLKTFEGSSEEIEHNLSVDCVIFTIQDNQLKVLLTKLFVESNWMLPGGFILKNEQADDAAIRILHQRTGAEHIFLEQFKIFSSPDRFSFESLFKHKELIPEDIIGFDGIQKRVISIGYFALVNYESLKTTGGVFEEDTLWADVKKLPTLAHDHAEIILEAIKALQKELYLKPIAYNLLPEKFTMPELQKLYEIILDKSIERSSFQKKMLKWNIYERLEERREGVAHKRPFLYRFDKQKFDEALNQGIRFGL